MLQIDLGLPHSYEIREVRELPGAGGWDIPVIYFPRIMNRPERDGVWLEVHPAAGRPWIGVFGFGGLTFSRVASSPHPERICIVSNGAGYFVSAKNPEDWEPVPLPPISDLRVVKDRSLLIFADFTRLCAYSEKGLLWRSPRVCWDELSIQKITGDHIEGVGYDPTNSGQSPFIVDLNTGRSLIPSPLGVKGEQIW